MTEITWWTKHSSTWLSGRLFCRDMKPTLKHQPAIWECMFGTLFARNAEGITKYFDHDWEAAIEYSGYTNDIETSDPRLARYQKQHFMTIGGETHPSKGQMVLFLKRG